MKRTAIIDKDGLNKLLSVVQSIDDPTKNGIVLLNPDWSTITGGGWGTVWPWTINEIAYFDTTTSIASLAVATYPSLTQLSYVKWVTSAIQTQINNIKTAFVNIPYSIDWGGGVIATGLTKGNIVIPFTGTITAWTLLGDQTGSITIDTRKDTYANYPATIADTMWWTKPNITTATKGQTTGLSIAVTAGDTIKVNVDSCSSITGVTLIFTLTRS